MEHERRLNSGEGETRLEDIAGIAFGVGSILVAASIGGAFIGAAIADGNDYSNCQGPYADRPRCQQKLTPTVEPSFRMSDQELLENLRADASLTTTNPQG